jgi:hypothetical protein
MEQERILGRLEAKFGPDFRGGWEKELIPNENEELFKESPSHSYLYYRKCPT